MTGIDLIGRLSLPNRDAVAAREVLDERSRRSRRFSKSHAELAPTYVANPRLCAAVDVALSLGRPLLLTGEPGSGKTLAASWIAHCLGLADTHFRQFQVHSDSRARDLRYEFDAVGWFRASQLASQPVPKKDFVAPRALGIAFGWPGKSQTERPYVVLIDEIDKAPRDFPNDLLLELDQMRFVVDETQETVGPPAERPIIVITSNAERRLPDPFLRRCVVHHIELDANTVSQILSQRIAELGRDDRATIDAATQFWTKLKSAGLTRTPTIAEYWQWLALADLHGELELPELIGLLTQGGGQASKLPFISTLLSVADLEILTGSGA